MSHFFNNQKWEGHFFHQYVNTLPHQPLIHDSIAISRRVIQSWKAEKAEKHPKLPKFMGCSLTNHWHINVEVTFSKIFICVKFNSLIVGTLVSCMNWGLLANTGGYLEAQEDLWPELNACTVPVTTGGLLDKIRGSLGDMRAPPREIGQVHVRPKKFKFWKQYFSAFNAQVS